MLVFKKTVITFFDAGLPVVTKMIFTLAIIKLISTVSEPGGLAKWGMLQNAVALLSATLSLSLQSGIASAKASGKDHRAFQRGVFLLFLMSFLFITLYEILCILGFESPIKIGVSSYILIFSGFLCAIYNYLYAYLPVLSRLKYLTLINFVFGVTVIFILYLNGLDSLLDQAIALTVGYTLAVGLVVLILRRDLFQTTSLWEMMDVTKAKYLIGFGAASFVNTAVSSSLMLYIRNDVIDASGQSAGDVFEAGVRLVALVEASFGSVIGLLVWKHVAKTSRTTIYSLSRFFRLSVFGVTFLLIVFILFGDFFVSVIFTSEYVFSKTMYISLIYFASMKIFMSIALMPLFLAGKIVYLILAELIYLFFSIVTFLEFGEYISVSLPSFAFLSLSVGLTIGLIFILVFTKSERLWV